MSHGHNAAFLKDPRAYMGNVTILTVGSKFTGFDANQSQARIYIDLVLVDSGMTSGIKLVRADFDINPTGDANIEGGWIPYIAEGTINATPSKMPALQLPIAGNPKFVFTGAMNGCSLVMATKGGSQWGIHYANSSGATQGYPHLGTNGYVYVKSIDYYQLAHLTQGSYGLALGADVNAASVAAGNQYGWFNTFAFFYYDTTWKILGQPQFAWQEGLKFKARTTGPLLEV